jgi:predicted  nucleic acid-binding Zn-ribbon protein
LQALEERLTDLSRRLDQATTTAELSQIETELNDLRRDLIRQGYDIEVAVGRLELRTEIQAQQQRVTQMRQNLDAIERVDRELTRELRTLQQELAASERTLQELETQAREASSQNQLEQLRSRLEQTRNQLDQLSRNSMLGDLGIRTETAKALDTLERLKYDPVGEVNQQANKNHYRAARQEATNQPLKKPDGSILTREDGTPYSHIRDLQNARNALENIRNQLQAENSNPLPTLTERGMETILSRLREVQQLIQQLDSFLNEIGWPASRPHRWILRDRVWVGEGDIDVLRPRLTEEIGGVRQRIEATPRTIGRVQNEATRAQLMEQQQVLLRDSEGLQQESAAATTEVAINQIRQRLAALRERVRQFEYQVWEASQR